jgi:hypothetical protein
LSIKSYAEIIEELDLNETFQPALFPRHQDPNALYKPWDPRTKPDYWPKLSKKSATVTVQDLWAVTQRVAAKYRAALQLVRYIGDNGFICSMTLTAGNFSGTTMPSVSAVESDLIKEIRDLYPVAKVECIDRDELFGNGPSEIAVGLTSGFA